MTSANAQNLSSGCAIRKGFDNLVDGQKYNNLYAAALCRAKADWLIGINGTRLFTTLYKGKTLNVGRVLTPTLTLLAEREAAIEHFKKEKFCTGPPGGKWQIQFQDGRGKAALRLPGQDRRGPVRHQEGQD